MYAKILKAVWFFSLVGFMALFMYVYAALPPKVVFSSGTSGFATTRDVFFYTSLLAILLINTLAFLTSNTFIKKSALKVFILGQIITLNSFFAILFIMTLLFNSGERFDLQGIGILLYASVTVVILWALSGLGYFTFRRLSR